VLYIGVCPYRGREGFPFTLYLLLPIVLGSVLLPLRWATLFVATAIGLTGLLPALLPGVAYPPEAASYLAFLVTIASVILLSAHHRNTLERTRKHEIAESEKRFRELAGNIPQVFWIATGDLDAIEYISPVYETMWGEPCSRIYANPTAWLERVIEEDRAKLGPAMRAAAAECEGVHELPEFRIRLDDGRLRWIRSRIFPVFDECGTVVRRAGVVEDITQRKRSEEEARRNRDRLQSIIDNAPVFIHIVDIEDRFLVVNRRYEQFFNVDTQNILGQRGDILFPPKLLHRFEQENRLVRQSGEPRTFETTFTHADGNSYHVLTTKFPLCDSEGSVYAVGGISTDITDSKNAEAALRDSERRYHMLINNIPYITWICNAEGRTVFISENVKGVCGYDAAAVCGSGPDLWLDRVHPDDTAGVRRAREALLGRGEPLDVEYRFHRPDGRWMWIRARSVDTYEKEGARYAYGLLADITERRAAREENERLQEQLRQSEKMEAVGQLAGGIAHDFNNQLAGIMGFADMIRLQTAGRGLSTLARYAEGILTAARHASELTEKLLAFARKGKLQSTAVDLHAVIDEVVSLLSHSIDKKITIHTTLAARTPTTRGDPTQLQNLFLNLGLNARDAMPEGGTLTFATEVADVSASHARRANLGLAAGRYLLVSVADTGMGMDAETLRHIFEPFFTTKERGRGTGMGLAAAFGTVHNHHGAIDVHSTLGHGTTFSIYLPLHHAADATTRHRDLPAETAQPGEGTIMLVEDEAVVRRMAGELMRHLGYTVIECADGPEALERYTESWRDIDLVVLDMIMPEMNGREVYRAMRHINPHAAALISSGYSIDTEAQAMLSEGVKGFLKKPFRRGELAQAIRRALGDAERS
jgi:PAS domain S-box-containing protein